VLLDDGQVLYLFCDFLLFVSGKCGELIKLGPY